MLKHALFMALTILAALVAVIYAFKLLFGLVKVVAIAAVLVLAAFLLFYFGGKAARTPRHGAPM
jgi:L-asparagine transporter-like permease